MILSTGFANQIVLGVSCGMVQTELSEVAVYDVGMDGWMDGWMDRWVGGECC
jgi:hypothetical protein